MKINEHDKKEIKGCMKLLEKIEKSEEEKGFKWTNLEQVFEVINKQQARIDKAIEYIEECYTQPPNIENFMHEGEMNYLLDILKGSDNDDNS